MYTVRTLSIKDTKTVTSVEIQSDSSTLYVGGSLTLDATVLPSTASQSVDWASNNATVATVSDSGVISGKSAGSATITVKAGAKTDTLRVVVQKATPVTEESSQVTSVAGINENLAKIDDILRYATNQLDALYVSGEISKDETTERKTILLNAFKMARFPWMSSSTITYYTGSGYFRKNVVYFGIPYTQKNRTFNVEKLLATGLYAKGSGNNYYTASMPARDISGQRLLLVRVDERVGVGHRLLCAQLRRDEGLIGLQDHQLPGHAAGRRNCQERPRADVPVLRQFFQVPGHGDPAGRLHDAQLGMLRPQVAHLLQRQLQLRRAPQDQF